MANKAFAFTKIAGGTAGCLDDLIHTNISDGDIAIVNDAINNRTYTYTYESTSALAESLNNIVKPDSNSGNGRWIRVWDSNRMLLIDPTVDQGNNAIVGTLAWHINDVSTDPTTIKVLPGTYKITTNITMPVTMVLDPDEGALFKPDATKKLIAHSPEHIIASPRQQIIDTTNNSTDPLEFTVGGTFYPGWWGAVADGAIADGSGTDNSAAINLAFSVAYDVGGKVKLPSGVYKILTSVGVTVNDAAARKAFPSFEGDQASQVQPNEADAAQTGTILMLNDTAGATSALKIHQTNTSGYFEGGQLRNFKIIRVNGSGPIDLPTDSANSKGLDIRHWVDHRIYNIVVQGFYYGIYSYWGYSSHWFGVSTTRNNYGIWFDEHSNAITVNGTQAHQNNVGVRINAGYGIQINGITAEGQDYGIVISNNDGGLSGPTDISIDGYNAESTDEAEISIGIDEDDATSTNTVLNVELKNIYSSIVGNAILRLDDVENVTIYDTPNQQVNPFTSITTSTKNVRILGHPGYEPTHFAAEKAVDQRIGIRHPYNLIANGWTGFPSLDFITEEPVTEAAWFDDSGDSGRTVIELESADGDSSTLIGKVYVQLDERMYGQQANCTVRAKREANVVVSTTVYDSVGSGISGSGMGPFTTSWAAYGEQFTIPSSGNFMYLAFVATNSSGGALSTYFENLTLTLWETGELIQSPIDVISGLSGNVTTDASGDATVTLTGRYYAARYNVIATVNENTFAIVRVTKSDGSFAIKTVDATPANVANVDVAWMVLPQAGIYGGY